MRFCGSRQPTGPLMCAEFWNGWFDNWGTHHHTTDAAASAAELDALLTAGASVNIYMFHGGTNFGFTNGANDKGIYEPTITSYDYDAPLSEDGHPTAKYFAFRDVIAKHFPVPSEVPAVRVPVSASTVPIARSVSLLDVPVATRPVPGSVPPVEVTGQYRGFYLYEVSLPAGGVLSVSEVRDRAQFFLDGVPVGVLSRELGERSVVIPDGGRLQVLLEDQGRVNYGQRIGEDKGLMGPALLNGVEVLDWEIGSVDLASLDDFRSAAAELPVGDASAGLAGPSVSFATFEADGPGDRFLRLDGWIKGNAFINGFNLGRYWSRGPQRTLYVPGPLIREGANELAILELHGSATREVSFAVGPDLGPDEK